MGTMNYSATEVLEYVGEEDVKFIRLAFCDVFGRQKNLSIMPGELARALDEGIPFDASAVDGFGDEAASDLFLRPDPATLAVLPWRPDHGRVVRMYCDVLRPGGEPFACDTRRILKEAVRRAGEEGVSFRFGPEMEFYLFKTGEEGERTMIPYDEAGYMDIAPDDRGENVRREICLTLEKMGIVPEGSHHEMGPGQNVEIVIAMKSSVSTSSAPAAIGPYSQGVLSELLFVSGQLPIDPATGVFPEGGIEEQTRQSLTNIKAILEAAGLGMDNVVKTTVFLADMDDFAAMNGVYAEFFSAPYPARSAVAVRSIPKGALVEIECIATRQK